MIWVVVLILQLIRLLILSSHIVAPRFRFFIDKMGLPICCPYFSVTFTQKDRWLGHILSVVPWMNHFTSGTCSSLKQIVLLDHWFSISILNQSLNQGIGDSGDIIVGRVK